MKKELVTVVIPIHLKEPSELEKISLQQTLTVLHQYPITFLAPTDLDTSWYEEYSRGKATIAIERFAWKGRTAFGKMMVDPQFFKRFLAYEYILICHMDAFVFRDELAYWCQQGYDYLSAVIYNPVWHNMESGLRKVSRFSLPEYFGNGGFALKKVEAFYRMTSRYKLYVDFYRWRSKLRGAEFLDDIFVSLHFPKLSARFKVPPQAVAERFGAAYEDYAEADLPFDKNDVDSLPFGMHGWIQFNPEYWKPVIRELGYAV